MSTEFEDVQEQELLREVMAAGSADPVESFGVEDYVQKEMIEKGVFDGPAEEPIEVKTFEELKKIRTQRRRVVMNQDPTFEMDGTVHFSNGRNGLYLEKDYWENLGSPTVVTVGVVTGNILDN